MAMYHELMRMRMNEDDSDEWETDSEESVMEAPQRDIPATMGEALGRKIRAVAQMIFS